jgi:hypothetical protein
VEEIKHRENALREKKKKKMIEKKIKAKKAHKERIKREK